MSALSRARFDTGGDGMVSIGERAMSTTDVR